MIVIIIIIIIIIITIIIMFIIIIIIIHHGVELVADTVYGRHNVRGVLHGERPGDEVVLDVDDEQRRLPHELPGLWVEDLRGTGRQARTPDVELVEPPDVELI